MNTQSLLEKYGYKWNGAYTFWQSSNKYLPDIDEDFETIYYKYGPTEDDCYDGGEKIASEDDLLKLIEKYKVKDL